MADLHIDSQLMNHMLPANAIDNKKHLLAIHDEKHQPLVFSIGNDGHLYAIKSNSSGSNDTINVSSAVGARGTVDAFIVKQANDSDSGIFVAFSNTIPDSSASELHVLGPFKPEVLNTPDQLTHYVIFGTAQNDKGQANKSQASDWPLLIASYNYIAEHNKDANISRILVEANKWRWTSDLRIYEQAKTTIAVAPGSLSVGDGLFILYKKDQRTTLMFTTIGVNDDSPWTADIIVPEGSNLNSISTYIEPDNYTGLILAGDGLWHIPAKDAWNSGNSVKKISSDPLYKGATNLHVAQSAEAASIWFSNADRVLGYQRANNSGVDGQMLLGEPVPLRPASSSIDYSAIIDPSTKSQSFIVVEDSSHLVLMEQATETKMWSSRPFLVNEPNGLVETNAFVSHVELQDSRSKQPLSTTKVNVSTSGWANLIINGTEYMVGKDKPATVETNVKGVLTIIQPSDGISAYTYTFSDVPGSDKPLFPSGPVTADPSKKVQDKIQKFTSVDELKKAGAKGTDDELKTAAKAIQDMHDVKSKLDKSNNTTEAAAARAVALVAASAAPSSGHSGWDFFEWVKHGVEKITHFVVKAAEDAWHFIVTVADKAWKFVLDSVTAVVKGIQLVLEKIGVALKKIWEYVKYLFEWDDIKATYEGVKSIVNSGLDYGIKIVGEKTEEVGKIFDKLEEQLGAALKVKLPGDHGAKKQSQASAESGNPSAAGHTKNVEVNNATYHFEEGKKTAKYEPNTTGDAIKSLWDDTIEPALKEAGAGAKRIADTIWEICKGELSLSVNEIFAVIGGEIVHLLVTLIKTIVQGLMGIGQIVLTGIKDLLNTSVWSFGIFGGLLKKLFHLPDFSILDVVAIVIAIPSTILAKLITGKAPKRIQNFDFARMVEKGPTDDQTLLAYNELASYIAITKALVDAVVNVVKMATAEIPVEPPQFSVLTLAADLIGLLISYPWDKKAPGRDYRIAIWGILLTNTIVLSVCTKASTPYTLKIMAASDILVGLSAFALVQVVHHDELTEEWKGRDEEKTGLNISSSVFEVIERLATAVGIIVPEPTTKLLAGAVMGTTAACKAVVKTGIAVKGAH
ncbi:hypothetical protein M407DRAFT_28906 [Tulasnella calospora MUT 4182]|uniref:Uncharacterized protein n=1 Tax=Tulasnella calospora MUT 4182 TaxID=1051891 RepID=A0A0C3QB57_9AGAM|nr:hypothetical protein M407DRAFT_28906 [Tulasnella calospora MUT 4182]